VLTGKYVAFVVEYVRGGSVSDYLAGKKMDEDLACYLFRQLLDAIAYCHAHKARGICSAGAGGRGRASRWCGCAPCRLLL
jgi:serine/threonine protein kinase